MQLLVEMVSWIARSKQSSISKEIKLKTGVINMEFRDLSFNPSLISTSPLIASTDLIQHQVSPSFLGLIIPKQEVQFHLRVMIAIIQVIMQEVINLYRHPVDQALITIFQTIVID